MNKNILFFAFGLVIGGFTAYKIAEKKFEQTLTEEIADIKNRENRRNSVTETVTHDEGRTVAKSYDLENEITEKEYRRKAAKYCSFINTSDKEERKEENTETTGSPYVISPDVYGEEESYETFELLYYKDGVLTDDSSETVYLANDVDNMIGLENLKRFGEYDEDSLHIRNDETKCYYEVLMVDSEYYGDPVSDDN